MVETVNGGSGVDQVAAAAQPLHDFNVEYGELAPAPRKVAARLAELIDANHVTVLLVRERGTGMPTGVAVMRVQLTV